MEKRENKDSCLLDKQRLDLEKTCVSLVSTYLKMRGSITNKLSAMPIKGLVMSKNSSKQDEKNASPGIRSEGTSVDAPRHHEISRLAEEVAKEFPDGQFVPNSLPQEMRENAWGLNQENFDTFYNVQERMQHVEKGELSHIQLVALYLRSFHNLLEYDLQGVEELKDRFVRHFGNILADILELCYPQLGTSQMDQRLHADLKEQNSRSQQAIAGNHH